MKRGALDEMALTARNYIVDVPMAYLESKTLQRHLLLVQRIAGMRRRVSATRCGASVENRADSPPMNVPASPEWADELGARFHFLVAKVRGVFELGPQV